MSTLNLKFPAIKAPMRFYAVVPDSAWVKKMLDAGADSVQLRCKNLPPAQLRREVQRAVAYAAQSNAQLFINDYWQLAAEYGAYGVHLGQEDLTAADLTAIATAGLRLGISTHSHGEMQRALAVNPSYVACGAVYPTTTKTMPTAPLGLTLLKQLVALAHEKHTPTVAIGGINLTNAAEVLATGVDSLAVVRAVTEAADPTAAVKQFQQLFSAA